MSDSGCRDESVDHSGQGLPDAASSYPPTVIVVHPRERRSKCSVEPLRGREGFCFFTFPRPVTVDLSGYIQLGIGGPTLSERDADQGLLLLDGTWKLAARMAPFYSHVPVRTLPAIATAYPRRSQTYDDPSGGLATIEALYAALRILRRPLHGLLDHYHWKQKFLEYNGWLDVDAEQTTAEKIRPNA